MRIPMLAIHLNRDILSEGFKMNKQTHLVPVLASAVKKAVNSPAANGAQGAAAVVDGQNKRQKVDGAGDAADTTPRTVKVRRRKLATCKQMTATSCHQDNGIALHCACLSACFPRPSAEQLCTDNLLGSKVTADELHRIQHAVSGFAVCHMHV